MFTTKQYLYCALGATAATFVIYFIQQVSALPLTGKIVDHMLHFLALSLLLIGVGGIGVYKMHHSRREKLLDALNVNGYTTIMVLSIFLWVVLGAIAYAYGAKLVLLLAPLIYWYAARESDYLAVINRSVLRDKLEKSPGKVIEYIKDVYCIEFRSSVKSEGIVQYEKTSGIPKEFLLIRSLYTLMVFVGVLLSVLDVGYTLLSGVIILAPLLRLMRMGGANALMPCSARYNARRIMFSLCELIYLLIILALCLMFLVDRGYDEVLLLGDYGYVYFGFVLFLGCILTKVSTSKIDGKLLKLASEFNYEGKLYGLCFVGNYENLKGYKNAIKSVYVVDENGSSMQAEYFAEKNTEYPCG